jgi:hypothetical protein
MRGVTAALSLILSAGVVSSYATPITVVGGNPTTADGWQISPDPGTTLNVTGVNSTGSATYENASDVFAPPLDSDVDYTSAQLGVPRTAVEYSGSQPSGATSDWGSSTNPDDDLLVSVDPSTGSDGNAYPDFTLQQSPQGVVSEVVNAPLAAWQSLAGLLVVVVLTFRPPKAAKAPA